MNIKQIIEAFAISFNPTDKQKELAELRYKICADCPSKKKVKNLKIHFCNECGCLISKKVFTNEINPCPLSKWGEIDPPYFPEQKEKKTLI